MSFLYLLNKLWKQQLKIGSKMLKCFFVFFFSCFNYDEEIFKIGRQPWIIATIQATVAEVNSFFLLDEESQKGK